MKKPSTRRKLKLKVKIRWQLTTGEPSPNWRRLWSVLLADIKAGSSNTYKVAGHREYKNGNKQNIPGEN